MHAGFGLFLFVISVFIPIQTNQGFHRPYSQNSRKHRDISSYDDSLFDSSSVLLSKTDPILFFQNEPVPLASSVVDDLTTLASAIYIISLIILLLLVLAWITHYNAPCSSIITSILSTITGLPEPIIHSVALCGLCCIWCEKTWLFRRIHQFNIWMSKKIKQFVSVTCKLLYDTMCPCCRPPDTPSNRSIIGSLPASLIAMINVPDVPHPTPPKTIVTVVEPTSMLPGSFTVNIDLNTQPTSESLIENQDYFVSNKKSTATKINAHQIDETRSKRKKRLRKQVQLQQRSAIGESSQIEEQINDTNEDEEEEEEEENTKIY